MPWMSVTRAAFDKTLMVTFHLSNCGIILSLSLARRPVGLCRHSLSVARPASIQYMQTPAFGYNKADSLRSKKE